MAAADLPEPRATEGAREGERDDREWELCMSPSGEDGVDFHVQALGPEVSWHEECALTVIPKAEHERQLRLAARAPEQLLDEARSALEDVDGFLETVTAWNGADPDELEEAQHDVRKMLARLAAASPNPMDGEPS